MANEDVVADDGFVELVVHVVERAPREVCFVLAVKHAPADRYAKCLGK